MLYDGVLKITSLSEWMMKVLSKREHCLYNRYSDLSAFCCNSEYNSWMGPLLSWLLQGLLPHWGLAEKLFKWILWRYRDAKEKWCYIRHWFSAAEYTLLKEQKTCKLLQTAPPSPIPFQQSYKLAYSATVKHLVEDSFCVSIRISNFVYSGCDTESAQRNCITVLILNKQGDWKCCWLTNTRDEVKSIMEQTTIKLMEWPLHKKYSWIVSVWDCFKGIEGYKLVLSIVSCSIKQDISVKIWMTELHISH